MEVPTTQQSETLATVPEAALIFVLAGLEARKAYGLQLFRRRRARGILLSVGRFEIRKLSMLDIPVPINLPEIAAPFPPPQRHYFVWFEDGKVRAERIPLGRFGTWSEIAALAKVLFEQPQIDSVIVVSSSYHLPRIRICCRALLPPRLHVQLLASPEGDCRKNVLAEWLKIPTYGILAWFPKLNVLRK
jgi:hypothetical protein